MTFRQRAIGAARLEVAVFEEIEADRHATGQAFVVVILSSLAAGIGLGSNLYNAPVLTRVILALLLWVFWATSTYAVGVYLLPEPQTQSNIGELLRTIGFAAAPGVLRIFGFVPGIGVAIYGIATGWMLVAWVIAIRQALDYTSTGRAVVVCLVAWLIGIALTAVIGGAFFVLLEEVVS